MYRTPSWACLIINETPAKAQVQKLALFVLEIDLCEINHDKCSLIALRLLAALVLLMALVSNVQVSKLFFYSQR